MGQLPRIRDDEKSTAGAGGASIEMTGLPLPTVTPSAEPFPEDLAGLLSRLSFSWMNPIIRVGAKRPLQESDVWHLNGNDQTATLYPAFEQHWEHERAAPSPSLSRAVYKFIMRRFWLGGFFKVFNDAAQFTGPLFLNALIGWVANPDRKIPIGVLLAVAMFVFQMLGALGEAQFFQLVMRSGMNVKAVLVHSVFRKASRLSNSAKQKLSTGRINTMIASDTDAVNMFINNAHNLWSAPLRVVICVALLFTQLGWSGVIGAALFPLSIPFQKFILGRATRLTKASKAFSDTRVKVVGEVFSAISVVKCYDWLSSFQSAVEGLRSKELSKIRAGQYLYALNFFVIFSLPMMVSVVAFASHVLLFGNVLTVAQAFTSLALFSVMTFPLFLLPMVLNDWVNAKVAIGRLQEYLLAEELHDRPFSTPDPSLPSVEISNGEFAWENDDIVLHDIDLSVRSGELLAVIGRTGCGKSSLLSSILCEMDQKAGDVTVRGSIAYVPQQAWIFGGSLRENVTFGRHDGDYSRAVSLACLGPDIEQLSAGHETELGERGVNLSGGQAQRVSLARAIYADADVYLFDDPLSALDANVGQTVFDKCICSALQGRTRILVTNQLQYLRRTDRIVLLKDGRIDAIGTFDELDASSATFREFVASELGGDSSVDVVSQSVPSVSGSSSAAGTETPTAPPAPASKPTTAGKALVVDEERSTGLVKLHVVNYFVGAFGGYRIVALLCLVAVTTEALRAASSIWLKVWGDQKHVSAHVLYFLGVYAALSMGTGVFLYVWRLLLSYFGVRAAKRLHTAMFANLLRAPMSFFDQTPLGRIISRFSKDTSDIDGTFPGILSIFILSAIQLVAVCGVMSFFMPLLLVAIVPVAVLFWIVWRHFTMSSREIQRLDSISRSPVYTHFSQCLNGIASIRAYRGEEAAAKSNAERIDNNLRFLLVSFSSNRWLSLRLELLGGAVVFGCALFIVLPVRGVDAVMTGALAGLLLTYALQLTGLLNRNVRLGSMAENHFNSIERILYYTEVPQEAPLLIEDRRPPAEWPQAGRVQFVNACMRYREGLPLVLNDLSVDIPGGARVGIVGRTGAGKSSIFNALFRLRELSSGAIVIDGVDISTVGLSDLRSRITIIPQTPVLFTGTLRYNLDPFEQYADADVWDALRRAHIADAVESLDGQLGYEVSEGGENFSVGQRALLCLARALLRQSRVIVLDEATAAVDPRTDELIQETIRAEFRQCTLLIIAHRLHTVMDSDAILVVGAGRLVEYGAPRRLLSDPGGALSQMVDATGPDASRSLRSIAHRNHLQ
ncbi:unnamed protein product (mitochondrion) [Plasmodiophora brassicae]|uniref:Uncharacterized protein n=1 Tax=Plasmodiophora brassicae TaxID=37360 RepID=A0A3P3YHX5_PLABS|nr:unnamed protein product [Plasmodiophora brassicae]